MRLHHHAYTKLRNTWTIYLRSQHLPAHIERSHITITRYWCGQPIHDWDNLYATAKIPLDALEHAGMIVKDDIKHVPVLTMLQERVATRKERHTTITVQPA